MSAHVGFRRDAYRRTGGGTTLVAVGSGAAVLVLAAAAAAFLLIGRTARGTVVSLSMAQPLAGATIESPYGRATTDDSGRFTLTGLKLGAQAVTVTVDGFEPFRTQLRVAPFGAGDSELALPDAAVTVRVEETALQAREATACAVKVGSRDASGTGGGTYVLKGLPPGETTITVTGPSYQATATTIDLRPGANDAVVRVRLTPAETYVRYFAAYKANRWKDAYAYLHPDVAKLESLATYTKDMRDWGTPVSIAIESTRMLARWESPYTKLAYTDVAEIRRTLLTEKGGVRIQSALPQHWTNVGGLWLRVDI